MATEQQTEQTQAQPETQTSSPAPTQAPTQAQQERREQEITTSGDASELARQTDEMLKANEALQAKLAALEKKEKEDAERLAKYEAQEKARKEKYAADQKAELEKTLEIQRQQYKDVHGEDAVLPVEYEHSAAVAFANEGAAPQMQAIQASALAYQKQKEANEAMKKQLDELNAKMKKLEDVNTVAMSHVNASKRRVFNTNSISSSAEKKETIKDNTDGENYNVTASSTTTNFEMMFTPAASKMDKMIMEKDYGRSFNLSTDVNASAKEEKKTFTPAPVHAQMEYVPNSMRHKFPHIFTHLCNQYNSTVNCANKVTHSYERGVDV